MSILYDEETIRRIHETNIKNEERENGIRALVSMCKKFGGSILDATESVVNDFGLSEQDAGTLVKKYW